MVRLQNILTSRGTLITLGMVACAFVAGCTGSSVEYFSRGTACAKKGQYDRAISNYDKAVVIDSKNADIYANRGYVYFIKGEYDRAIVNYNRAIEINPNYAEVYINRGNAYSIMEEYDRAMEYYEKSLS